jgi:DNA-binding protein YbaB
MFDKIKQIKKMRDLQQALAMEKAEVEKEGVKAVVNGNMKVEEIKINPNLEKEKNEELAKECINEAMKKVQMIAAQKMSQEGIFGG